MSSVDLIQPLLKGSGLLSQCATASTKEKNARQLLSASLKFLDLARQVRLGQLKIPDADVAACAKEVNDTNTTASSAASEADYPDVIVEANEAIDVIGSHAGSGAQLVMGRTFAANAFGASGHTGLTPFPDSDPLPWPPTWPVWPRPRPLPPWWPPVGPPGPWGPWGPWGPSGPDPRSWDQRHGAGGVGF